MPGPGPTLAEKRIEFTTHLAKLLTWAAEHGYRVALAEVLRGEAQATANAVAGRGIANSLHLQGLAADLLLYSPSGAYIQDSASYLPLGEAWEALHPENAWGGRFKRPDGGHFSRSHGGRR